jgi:hypothetical protein
MTFTAHAEWQKRFIDVLENRWESEMRSGYDEKIGLAAVGRQLDAVRRQQPAGGPLAFCARMVRALFAAYADCELDGEYSTGRSSMKPGLDEIVWMLPEELVCLRDELAHVVHFRERPPTEMVARNDASIAKLDRPPT